MLRNTRGHISDPIFGSPHDFSVNMLPTYEEVMKCYLWLRYEIKLDSKKEPTVLEISTTLCKKIKALWQKASIPVLSDCRIMTLIRSYHQKYMKLMKQPKAKICSKQYKNNVEKFQEQGKTKLFDIAACKCEFSSCKCDKSRRVPTPEQEFLLVQRTVRRMAMGTIDTIATKKPRKVEERKMKVAKMMEKVQEAHRITNNKDILEISDEDDEIAKPSTSKDEDFTLLTPEKCIKEICTVKSNQMRLRLPSLAQTCDRYGVSNRAVAASSCSSAFMANY